MPALAVIVFFVALLPLSASFVSFHADEYPYTHTALSLLQSGDVPALQASDGERRPVQPTLTHWMLYGSYKLFGVGLLPSRLPFLLAGAVIIWLAYRMAAMLLTGRRTALIAATVTATHPLLIMAAIRATPDILFALWLTISAFGFMRVMLLVRPTFSAQLAAYGGAGLAAATQHPISVVILVLVTILFLLFNPWRRVPPFHAIYPPGLIIGFVIGVLGFIVKYAFHPELAFGRWGEAIVQLWAGFQWQAAMLYSATTAIALVLLFTPWIFPAASVWLSHAQEEHADSGHRRRAIIGFIQLWAVTIILLASIAGDFSLLFVLTMVPLLALLIAEALSHADPDHPSPWARKITYLIVFLVVLFLAGLGMANWYQERDLLALVELGGLFLAAIAVFLFGRKNLDASIISLGGALLLLPMALLLLLRPIIPDQAALIADKVEQLGLVGSGSVAYLGPAETATKLRLATGAQLNLREMEQFSATDQSRFVALIYTDLKRPDIDFSDYEIFPVLANQRRNLAELPVESLEKGPLGREVGGVMGQERQRYFVAVRWEQ